MGRTRLLSLNVKRRIRPRYGAIHGKTIQHQSQRGRAESVLRGPSGSEPVAAVDLESVQGTQKQGCALYLALERPATPGHACSGIGGDEGGGAASVGTLQPRHPVGVPPTRSSPTFRWCCQVKSSGPIVIPMARFASLSRARSVIRSSMASAILWCLAIL